MKLSERLTKLFGTSNERMIKAYIQCKYCCNDYVGCQENGIMDEGEDSDQGKRYIKCLTDMEGMRKYLYSEAFMGDTIYEDGGCRWGASCKKYLTDIRFVGEDVMRTIVDWVLLCSDKKADYPCGMTLEKFNELHPNHAQEA